MAINDKTRKVLWGRSGNRCAICRRELVLDATTVDDVSVVGEECHIVSAPYLSTMMVSAGRVFRMIAFNCPHAVSISSISQMTV